ncbi:hypothetical protein GCM10010211_63180 [Streptomyces albospinus]|uniref:Uncharacterized protein n=1 Tax=Streptomyces albospinus TaxID=285515 RepID=A0ABQ2VJ46_9ACTN|nr:hypothetical protein GCM10010211_63180 [Streptomyces albospinus]
MSAAASGVRAARQATRSQRVLPVMRLSRRLLPSLRRPARGLSGATSDSYPGLRVGTLPVQRAPARLFLTVHQIWMPPTGTAPGRPDAGRGEQGSPMEPPRTASADDRPSGLAHRRTARPPKNRRDR